MSSVVATNNLGPEFDLGAIQSNKVRLKLGDGLAIAPDGTISATIMTQTGYTIFPIWAEESGALASSNRQWSFGNGATGNINIPVPDCEVYALAFDAEVAGTSVSIELMQNNAAVASELFTGASGYVELASPVSFSQGDLLGFRTDVETGAYTDARVIAWCRIPLVGLKGADGAQGPQGIGGAPNALAKINVNAGIDVNGANVDITFGSTVIDTIGLTVAGNQITLPAGSYEARLIINTSSTAQRPNQSLSLFLDGVLESTEQGEGYIRAQSGHNEAKITHTDFINTAGGVINYTSNATSIAGVVTATSGKLLIHKIA